MAIGKELDKFFRSTPHDVDEDERINDLLESFERKTPEDVKREINKSN